MNALGRTFELMDEAAPRAVGSVIKSGAQSLCDEDSHFWSRVRRVCGEEFVGAELTDIGRECDRIRDLEIARGKISHWTYCLHRHMAALQLRASVSARQARDVQMMKRAAGAAA